MYHVIWTTVIVFLTTIVHLKASDKDSFMNDFVPHVYTHETSIVKGFHLILVGKAYLSTSHTLLKCLKSDHPINYKSRIWKWFLRKGNEY